MVTVWRGTAELPHQHRAGLQPLAALVTHLLSPYDSRSLSVALSWPPKACSWIRQTKSSAADPATGSSAARGGIPPSRRLSAPSAAGRQDGQFQRLSTPAKRTGRLFSGQQACPEHAPNHAPFAPEVQSDLMSRCDIGGRRAVNEFALLRQSPLSRVGNRRGG